MDEKYIAQTNMQAQQTLGKSTINQSINKYREITINQSKNIYILNIQNNK